MGSGYGWDSGIRIWVGQWGQDMGGTVGLGYGWNSGVRIWVGQWD